MSKSEFQKLREKYPDIFDNPSVLPTYVRQIALFVQQELELEEGGTGGEEGKGTEGKEEERKAHERKKRSLPPSGNPGGSEWQRFTPYE
jgi:hypothetical protein